MVTKRTWRRRSLAAASLMAIVAVVEMGCGGGATAPGPSVDTSVTPTRMSAAATATPTGVSTMSPSPSPTGTPAGCVFAERTPLELPPALAADRGAVVGVASTGEVLVAQRSESRASLSVFDPKSGAMSLVVTRSSDLQVVDPVGNESWVVWVEMARDGMGSDSTTWAYDRRSKATWEVRPPDRVIGGLGSALSLFGNRIVWAGVRETTPEHYVPTAYVADLGKRVVRRLADNVTQIDAVSPDKAYGTVVDHVGEANDQFVVVNEFDLRTGVATKAALIPPTVLGGFAASADMMVVTGVAGGAASMTAIDLDTGLRREVESDGMWPVAGSGFVAWTTEADTLVLFHGSAMPFDVASRPGASWVMASGEWLAWWEGPSDQPPRTTLAHVQCDAAAT